jgi:nitrogen fixation protein FixH
MIQCATPFRLRSLHVLGAFALFFGVVFAVNAAFLYEALTTKPGEEAGASYQAGLRYNAILADSRQQNALDWHHVVRVHDGTLSVTLEDGRGAAVGGLTFDATIGRPASDKADTRLAFTESRPGLYETRLPGLSSGTWVLAIAAQATSAGPLAVYRVKERLWLDGRPR